MRDSMSNAVLEWLVENQEDITKKIETFESFWNISWQKFQNLSTFNLVSDQQYIWIMHKTFYCWPFCFLTDS